MGNYGPLTENQKVALGSGFEITTLINGKHECPRCICSQENGLFLKNFFEKWYSLSVDIKKYEFSCTDTRIIAATLLSRFKIGLSDLQCRGDSLKFIWKTVRFHDFFTFQRKICHFFQNLSSKCSFPEKFMWR